MEFSNKDARKRLIVYSLVFIFILILYHLSIKVYIGDDVTYFMSVLDRMELVDFLQRRYNTWSSRTVIEALLVLFVRNAFLWKITDIGVLFLLAYSLYELSHKVSFYGVMILLLLYPLVDMASAGWIATMMNYYWPLAFGFYSLIVIDRLAHGIEVHGFEIVLSYLALIIGVSNEQYCAVHLAILIMYTMHMAVNRRINKAIWVYCGQYLIATISFIYILTCPGNYVRKASEVTSWMQDFYKKNIMDQFIDGFENTMSILLSSSNILFLAFVIFLFICVWKKTDNSKHRIISAVPMLSALVITFGNTNRNGFFSSVTALITGNIGVTATNWIKLSGYIPIIIYGCILWCIVASFFFIFDNLVSCLECVFLFGVSIVSRIIIGFSPTLFVSNKRTFLFCYGLLILVMLKIYEYMHNSFTKEEIQWGKYITAFVGIVVVLNNLVGAGNIF